MPRLLGVLLAMAGLIAGTLAAKSSIGTTHNALTPARRGQVRRGLNALPVPARGPVSATLGRNDQTYWVRSLAAQNPAQRFTARFTADGVVVSSGTGKLSLRMAAIGRGAALHAVPATSAHASANRVTFVRTGLREWYENGPLGLEQGFDIQSRPAGPGVLTLAMALSPGVRAHLDGAGAVLTGSGVALRYSGLTATDARGDVLPVWLSATRDGLEIRVNDRGAAYPLHIDPLVQQGSKLVPSDASGSSTQGFSVALSSDGNTALVGGTGDNGGEGAAWVFTRSGATWTQQGPKLVGSDDGLKDANQGFSVALSDDGNVALVGGVGENAGQGAAWVFSRSGSTWTQTAKLVGSGGSSDASQGFSVALSGAGTTALVGGANDANSTGAAWVFTLTPSGWTPGPKLVATDASGPAQQGYSVALSSDGSTALIGGNGDSTFLGAAWVWTRSVAGVWSEQRKLVGSNAVGHSNEGFSVALSSDGNTALVGGPQDNNYTGAAWVFTRSGSTWAQQGSKLVANDATGMSYQGFGVALSSAGDTALIGGPGDNHNLGASWIYTRSGSTWSQQGPKLVGSSATGQAGQGWGVALSADGGTALVGGPHDGGGLGGAWVFAPGRSLNVSITGSGSVAGSGISCPGTCAQTYADATSVTLTATAAAGSTFSGWSGACSGVGACNVTMNSDEAVNATFVRTSGSGGTGGSGGSGGAGSGSGSGSSETHRPVLTGLKISPRKLVLTGRFARGVCAAATHSNLRHPVCIRPTRSRVSYRLSIAANVTFTIQRVLPGRRFRGRCVRPTATSRRHASCNRLVRVRGSIVRSGHSGSNAFTFNDQIGGRRLAPGSYVLTATPSASGRSGTAQTVAFMIVK